MGGATANCQCGDLRQVGQREVLRAAPVYAEHGMRIVMGAGRQATQVRFQRGENLRAR